MQHGFVVLASLLGVVAHVFVGCRAERKMRHKKGWSSGMASHQYGFEGESSGELVERMTCCTLEEGSDASLASACR